MSTDVMTEGIREASPRLKARIAGIFADLFVHERLLVPGNAAATAANILAHEPLYRLGGAAILVMLVCHTAVSLILYYLLKPVSRSLSLLAAFLPRILGVLVAIAGLCYLTTSFAAFPSPPLASYLYPSIFATCFLAELSLFLAPRGRPERSTLEGAGQLRPYRGALSIPAT